MRTPRVVPNDFFGHTFIMWFQYLVFGVLYSQQFCTGSVEGMTMMGLKHQVDIVKQGH